MFGSVRSSILMFGEHYKHLGSSIFFQFYFLSIHFLSMFSRKKISHFQINNFFCRKEIETQNLVKNSGLIVSIKVWCLVLPVQSSVLKFKCHVWNVQSSVCQCSKCSMLGILVFDPPLAYADVRGFHGVHCSWVIMHYTWCECICVVPL